MSKEPIIETDRLILRPLTLDDAEACYSWNSDDRVTKYMSHSTHTDIGQTIDWIRSTFTDKDEWLWAFVLKEKNRVIGTGSIGPNAQMKDYWGIGYILHYDYWHKGYCTEAMKAIIDFVHKELGVNKICSSHAVDNPRSGKVMEKCGLKFDHYGEHTKLDGSQTFKSKFYKTELE
ncbi:MAG: GNAT family N-acetyltransferase [Clostridiales bacterium]|nr:GNAT family N-acetyltransferase [Clostridiales bacterium]